MWWCGLHCRWTKGTRLWNGVPNGTVTDAGSCINPAQEHLVTAIEVRLEPALRKATRQKEGAVVSGDVHGHLMQQFQWRAEEHRDCDFSATPRASSLVSSE